MSYCSVCGHHVEIVDSRFVHACRHMHKHAVPFSISEAQRESMVPEFAKGVTA